MAIIFKTFEAAIQDAKDRLASNGRLVHTEKWQGMDIRDNDMMTTHELMNHSFTCKIDSDVDELKRQIKPNLPWADDHFLERVGEVGLNPGVQYANWPYYKRQSDNDQHRVEQGKFSHTYMERMWPNNTDSTEYNGYHNFMHGIRYRYGDLNDVRRLLQKEPLTRQAFLPIWYPEDTGSVHGGRVPCTLGYHFMMRENKLHMWYPIRACDFNRHFRDDIYLACRLLLWMLDELREYGSMSGDYMWNSVTPGNLTMQIYSLHVFKNEVPLLRR
jgi:thymidylate synthase